MAISFEVNGKKMSVEVEPRMTLADCLRHQLGLTGTHVGCEHGVCGACTVIVDGRAVRACLMLAVQAEGTKVVTVEGLSNDDALSPLQASFRKHHALQCGFCTPGFLMLAEAYLAEQGLVYRPQPGGGAREGPGFEQGNDPSGDSGGRGGGVDEGDPSEAEVRELVASNLCRCTGYQGIIEAVLATARERRVRQGDAAGGGRLSESS